MCFASLQLKDLCRDRGLQEAGGPAALRAALAKADAEEAATAGEKRDAVLLKGRSSANE